MDCKICHEEIIEFTSKEDNIYTANPFDKSPHSLMRNDYAFCVLSWGEFFAALKKKRALK